MRWKASEGGRASQNRVVLLLKSPPCVCPTSGTTHRAERLCRETHDVSGRTHELGFLHIELTGPLTIPEDALRPSTGLSMAFQTWKVSIQTTQRRLGRPAS